MGFDDPEDVIPAIIIIVSLLGLIGALAVYLPVINSVPVLNVVSSVVNSGFIYLGNLLTTFIPLSSLMIAMIMEILLIVISIVIIVKVGY